MGVSSTSSESPEHDGLWLETLELVGQLPDPLGFVLVDTGFDPELQFQCELRRVSWRLWGYQVIMSCSQFDNPASRTLEYIPHKYSCAVDCHAAGTPMHARDVCPCQLWELIVATIKFIPIVTKFQKNIIPHVYSLYSSMDITKGTFIKILPHQHFFSGDHTYIEVQALDYRVIETDFLTNETSVFSSAEFKQSRYTGTHHGHEPDVSSYFLRKNPIKKMKKFKLDISVERLIMNFAYSKNYMGPWNQWHYKYQTFFLLHIHQLYYDTNDWVECLIKVTELKVKGNIILDTMYPKQSVRIGILTKNTGFTWFYGVTNPVTDGLLLYHKPSDKTHSTDILVDIEKAKCSTCDDKPITPNFAQSCIIWKSQLHFSHQTAAQMISLPGHHFHHIRLTKTKQTNFSSHDSIFAYWPRELCPFHRDDSSACSSTCKKHLFVEYHPMFNNTHNETLYHYVHLLQHFCDPLMRGYYLPQDQWLDWYSLNFSRDLSGTWNEASELCKSEGGTLPIIRTKHEHDQIITLCKCSLTIMEVMFIGLSNSPANKVLYFLWTPSSPSADKNMCFFSLSLLMIWLLCSNNFCGKMVTLPHSKLGWMPTMEIQLWQNTKRECAWVKI